MTPCKNCGREEKPLRKGRCMACYQHKKRTGTERSPWREQILRMEKLARQEEVA